MTFAPIERRAMLVLRAIKRGKGLREAATRRFNVGAAYVHPLPREGEAFSWRYVSLIDAAARSQRVSEQRFMVMRKPQDISGDK